MHPNCSIDTSVTADVCRLYAPAQQSYGIIDLADRWYRLLISSSGAQLDRDLDCDV